MNSDWREAALTLPGWLEDADQPEDPRKLGGFSPACHDVAINIASGGAVELQQVNSGGAWETFATVTEAADHVFVANQTAIRFQPVGGTEFRLRWR